jgi:hypothetical protein
MPLLKLLLVVGPLLIVSMLWTSTHLPDRQPIASSQRYTSYLIDRSSSRKARREPSSALRTPVPTGVSEAPEAQASESSNVLRREAEPKLTEPSLVSRSDKTNSPPAPLAESAEKLPAANASLRDAVASQRKPASGKQKSRLVRHRSNQPVQARHDSRLEDRATERQSAELHGPRERQRTAAQQDPWRVFFSR